MIMIMLMTNVMSCNCCAFGVCHKFFNKTERERARAMEWKRANWLHLSGQCDLYLCRGLRVKWSCGFSRWSSVVSFNRCNHFMVSSIKHTQVHEIAAIIAVQLSQTELFTLRDLFSSYWLHFYICIFFLFIPFFGCNSLECQQISLTAI